MVILNNSGGLGKIRWYNMLIRCTTLRLHMRNRWLCVKRSETAEYRYNAQLGSKDWSITISFPLKLLQSALFSSPLMSGLWVRTSRVRLGFSPHRKRSAKWTPWTSRTGIVHSQYEQAMLSIRCAFVITVMCQPKGAKDSSS